MKQLEGMSNTTKIICIVFVSLLVGMAAQAIFFDDTIATIDRNIEKARVENVMSCREHIRNGLTYPSSFDQAVFSTSSKTLDNGDVVVVMPFEAKNGFGNVIPQTANCMVRNGQVIEAEVVNR